MLLLLLPVAIELLCIVVVVVFICRWFLCLKAEIMKRYTPTAKHGEEE